MKRTIATLALALALGAARAATGDTAAAEAGAERPHTNRTDVLLEKILHRFDLDGDGKIGPQEKAAAQKFVSRFKAAADTDGDGKVSPEERAAAFAKLDAQITAFRAQLGKDGDGKLKLNDLPALKETLKEKGHELTAPFDTNGDGKVDKAERAAAMDALLKRDKH